MELTESIRSLAHRTLRGLAGFRSSDPVALPGEIASAMLPSEELLGVYENSHLDPQANLVFTTRGVYKFEQRWICLEYTQMARIEGRGRHNPGFDNQFADTLVVHDKDGRAFDLIISRGKVSVISEAERRFPDLWEALRFFDRVISRVGKEQV